MTLTAVPDLLGAWRPFLRGASLLCALLPGIGLLGATVIQTRRVRRHQATLRGQAHELDTARHRLAEMQALFDAHPDGVLLIDDAGKIVRLNPRLSAMTGYEAAELIGHPIDILLPQRHRWMHGAQMDGYLRSPQSRGMASGKDVHACRRDGSELPVSVTLGPVTIDGRRHVIATLRDVTGARLAKDALRASLRAAESASRAKSSFVASISHEIRTPLNGILGMADLTLSTPLAPLQRQYLDVLRTSAEGMRGIVNDILDFSRIEAGQMHMDNAPFKLSETVCQVAKSLAAMAHEKNLDLACDIAPDLPETLVGDATRLRQILWNLLGNAIKFTERGEIVLSVRRSGLAADDAHLPLHFSVCDSGIGIPRDKHALIFEKFMQADSATTHDHGGTGLGLAICRHLVTMMGGHIWIDSEPGRGSTFHFTALFGIAKVENRLRTLPAGGHKRVLIADARAASRRIHTATLRAQGIAVVPVRSGEEALTALATARDAGAPFDLILIDSRLPDAGSLALARRLEERATWRRIPVVLLGDGGHGAGDGMPPNVVANLIKPVGRDELLDLVARIPAVPETPATMDAPPAPAGKPRNPHLAAAGGDIIDHLLHQTGGDAVLALMLIDGCLDKLNVQADALDDAIVGGEREDVIDAAGALHRMVSVFGPSPLLQMLDTLMSEAHRDVLDTHAPLRDRSTAAIRAFEAWLRHAGRMLNRHDEVENAA